MGMYNGLGLTMKVQKHLHTDNDKAAMYFAARSLRDGRPEEGSAEWEELQQLKAAGYRFRLSPDGADVVAEKPNGRYYSGRECLASWNELTG